MDMTFNPDRYLARVGLKAGDITPDANGLARLQLAQTSTIPFENFEPLTGGVPALDGKSLWQKLVADRRGGYCLELNSLFGMALEAFGFEATPVLGRVRMGAPHGGPRAHHAFVVTINGEEYLADTGFGGPAPVLPVRLGTQEPRNVRGETFRIRMDETSGEEVLERLNGEDWFSLYGFDRVAVSPPDYEAANFVCARWDKSPFPHHLMMTIVTEGGRNSLFNRTLKRVREGKTEQEDLTSFARFKEAMGDRFGLPEDEPLYRNAWDRLTAPTTAHAG
jgi:N-hydroxyarylamine O-acetyltransferase